MKNIGNMPDVKNLSDKQLWLLYLIPRGDDLRLSVKAYLDKAENEFHKRGIKLKPIITAKHKESK